MIFLSFVEAKAWSQS